MNPVRTGNLGARERLTSQVFAPCLIGFRATSTTAVPNTRPILNRSAEALESTGVFPFAVPWTSDVIVTRCINASEDIIAETKIAGWCLGIRQLI